jgi:hypothetical protein
MMKYSSTKFKIEQMRMQNLIAMIESVAVFVFCFFVAVFLPNILYKYLYSNPMTQQPPAYLDHMPAVIFAIGVLNFLYVLLMNLARRGKIAQLEKDMESLSSNSMEACCANCGGNCDCDDHGNCACGCGENGSEMTMAEAMTDKNKVTKKKKARK